MASASSRYGAGTKFVAAAMAFGIAGTALAQDQAQAPRPSAGVAAVSNPDTIEVFGQAMPSVVKATALVNGSVITQTDVDQRLAWMVLESGNPLPAEQLDPARQQILRDLIDERLQVQAARDAEITITDKDVDRAVDRYASTRKTTVDKLENYLKSQGSSIRTVRQKIEGEMAWSRLQNAKIESTISVGDEEVQSVLDKMNADKGTQEFRVGEIFFSATQAQMPEAMQKANQVIERVRAGGDFGAYARQFSEASTAAVGGDLGWVRPGQLPDALANRVRGMRPGQLSSPIALPGGVSVIGVFDTRRVLAADPYAANLSLKQLAITFPQGTTRAQAEPVIARFAEAARNIGGCGGADRVANQLNAEVVQDERKLRDLPPILREMILPMQVGQATQPWGSLEEGVKILVLCGRDEEEAAQPTFDSVFAQLNEERIGLRARRYLRDLRRDAVIEFR